MGSSATEARSLDARTRASRPAPRRPEVAPPTIVQVVQSLGSGGLETMSVNLAVGLRDRGFTPRLLALDAGGVLEERLRDEGIAFDVLGDAHFARASTHRRLAALFRRLRPRVVHTHHLPALLNAAPTAWLGGRPTLVHTEHAYQYLTDAARLRAAVRWTSRLTRRFVVVGAEMAPFYRDVVHVAERRLRVIPNGIQLQRYAPPRDVTAQRQRLGLPDGFLVGTAGRFAPEKNLPMLLRAVARVRALGHDVRLVLAGDGAERDDLARLADELEFRDAVHFLGWRTDVPAILGCLDVFALTSWTEGLPLAVLEAMACGVPVVATSVGDLPNVIVDGRSGRLVAPGDDAALADVLAHLASHADDRAALARAGRDVVAARFSQDGMIDAYLDAYGLAAAAPAPRPT